MDWREFEDKSVNEALTQALIEMELTSDQVEYEIIEEEKSGFLGLGSRPAKIRVRKKQEDQDVVISFLENVFDKMNLKVNIEYKFDEAEKVMDIELSGDQMGVLIGKRGQTLDALQYLSSLVLNKGSEEYIKVKIDTENYRERRKETIENLARNVAKKVKKTFRPAFLEPMNPYERRIIHSALQDDKYVDTHSEGDEPHRKVVVTVNKEFADELREKNRERGDRGGYRGGRRGYSNNRGNRRSSYNNNNHNDGDSE